MDVTLFLVNKSMKLYLHVGPHKTGTTLIQKTLLDNQQAIFRKGLFYPKQFIRIFGHHEFRSKVEAFQLTDDDVRFLEHAGKDILLSSEDLISLSQQHFEYLKDRLSTFEIEIIYAWRRGSKKMFSIWQEIVKHGGTETFFEYHFSHIAKPGTSAMLSPDVKLNMFSRVFGKQNIKIIDYDAAAEQDNLLELFFGLVGITQTEELVVPLSDKNASNRSLTFYDSELIRALNCVFAKIKNIHGPAVRVAFNENRDKLSQDKLNSLLDIIKQDCINVNADKYFIDQRSEKVMCDNFAECIVNYKQNSLSTTFNVSGQKWLVDSKAFALVHSVSEELSHFL